MVVNYNLDYYFGHFFKVKTCTTNMEIINNLNRVMRDIRQSNLNEFKYNNKFFSIIDINGGSMM